MSAVYPAETNNGVVTSWIPLTTIWSSVQACSDSYMLEGSRLVAFDPAFGISVVPGVRCQPNAVTTWWNQGILGGSGSAGRTAVSLLPITCPNEWNTVATYVKSSVSTQVMCCPPGYTLVNTKAPSTSVNGDCVSDVSFGTVLRYASPLNANTNSYIFTSTTVTTDSSVGVIAVVGWNVQTTASSTSESTGGQSDSNGAVSSLNTPSPSLTASNASATASSNGINNKISGLSTGAKAGICIGAAASVLIVIALIAWIVILKRRNSKSSATTKTGDIAKVQPYYTDPDGDLDPYKPHEVSSTAVLQQTPFSYKMHQYNRSEVTELSHEPVRRIPAELAAS